MKKALIATLVVVAVAVVGFGAMILTSDDVQAVGCPIPSRPITGPFCGGIAGIECPGNMVCIDDPQDDCCPQTGGADCGGVCISAGRIR